MSREMGREIKFRVWSEEDKEYRKDCLLLKLFDCVTGLFATIFNDEGDRFDIEQYTGLKDKNGKEIYEGDIIKARDWDGDWGKYRIKWKQSHCAFEAFECRKHGKWNWTLQGFGGIEVIGNIHENPELLEYK